MIVWRTVALAAVPLGATVFAACNALTGVGDLTFTSDAGSCRAGDRQCSGSTPEVCVSGAWQSRAGCDGGAPFCVNGECASEPPSCQAGGDGASHCGAAGDSCCTSFAIGGGGYHRTYADPADSGVDATDFANVSAFRLDEYEVTVGPFRRFVAAALPASGHGYVPAPGFGKHTYLPGGALVNSASPGAFEAGWEASFDVDLAPSTANLTSCPDGTWTAQPSGQENLPINCVTWAEAYAFCIWDGGFLPSEAEWEYVAAGGAREQPYPWGSADPGASSQYAIYGDGDGHCYYPTGELAGCKGGVSDIAPVGTATLGASLWGQKDLAGSVFEWALDLYATYVDPCTDCAYLGAGSYRIERGGFYESAARGITPPARASTNPAQRAGYLGFRCARAP